jgi:hypothetical protein
MVDKSELLHLPGSGKSSLIRSEVHSSLIARGRLAATELMLRKKASVCLAVVGIDGKWGAVDNDGGFTVPPIHKWLGSFSNGRACFSRVANGDARPILSQPRFDHGMKPVDGDRFEFRYGQQPSVLPDDSLGYIEASGEVVITPQFVCAEPFQDGIARVATKERAGTGFLGLDGKYVFEPQFDSAANFEEGFAIVEDGGFYGVIHRRGGFTVQPRYDYIWNFSEGLARVLVGEKIGFISGSGELVIDPVFDAAGKFSEGLAPVCIKHDWGYIDNSGAFIIEPMYYDANLFSKGEAEVHDWDSDEPFWIDTTGNRVASRAHQGEELSEIRDGLARICQDGQWGFRDSSGNIIVAPIFREAGAFSNGLARVMNSVGLWGFVDVTGQIAIPNRFYDARDFLIVDYTNVGSAWSQEGKSV